MPSKLVTTPAPIGGFNARDGLASMPAMDAVELINWIPDVGGIRSRKGYQLWSSGLVLPVGGLLPYFAPSAAFPGGSYLTAPTSVPGKLFASTDSGIYDISTSGAVGAASIALSGSANAGWMNSVLMTNSAGTFTLACSETDGYYTYDGAAWLKVTLGGGANQVSVVDPTTFVQVMTWKNRAWFVQRNSAKAAYLTTNALYGVAASFDFGPVFKHGGQLSYLATWTIDAGEGVDDFLVAVSSNGDVAIYKGTDPTSVTTFALVGTWYVGQIPVGRRAFTQYGGDLIIAGADGIYPISYVTRGGADFLVASSKEYSSKIRPALGEDLRGSFTARGWQMLVHPSERVLIVNVPDYSAVTTRQWAMSTTLNEWCRFVGMPVYSMAFTGGYAFAGDTAGNVWLLLTGDLDGAVPGVSLGDYIEGTVIPAFSLFDKPGVEKCVHGVRPNFVSPQAVGVAAGIAVNYAPAIQVNSAVFSVSSSGLWNSGLWNSAIWGGNNVPFSKWFTDTRYGFSATGVIKTLTQGVATLASIDYLVEYGTPSWA